MQVLNAKYNAKVFLVLATSDNTDRAVKQVSSKDLEVWGKWLPGVY